MRNFLREMSINRRSFLIYLGPFVILILLIAVLYEPYNKYIKALKEEYKDKKQIYRSYQQRFEEIPKLKEELKALQKGFEEATKLCYKANNSDDAKSKFFQMVSSEFQEARLGLEISEPKVENHGYVDIFTISIQGKLTDIKPFLLSIEKLKNTGNVMVETLDIKVENPQNPSTLQVNLKLVACNLRSG